MIEKRDFTKFIAICPVCMTTRQSGDVEADRQWVRDHVQWHAQEPR